MGINPGLVFEVVLGAFVGTDVDDFFDVSIVPTISENFIPEVLVMIRIGLRFSSTDSW